MFPPIFLTEKSTRLGGCRCTRKPTLFMFQMLSFRSFSNLGTHRVICSVFFIHQFLWSSDWITEAASMYTAQTYRTVGMHPHIPDQRRTYRTSFINILEVRETVCGSFLMCIGI